MAQIHNIFSSKTLLKLFAQVGSNFTVSKKKLSNKFVVHGKPFSLNQRMHFSSTIYKLLYLLPEIAIQIDLMFGHFKCSTSQKYFSTSQKFSNNLAYRLLLEIPFTSTFETNVLIFKKLRVWKATNTVWLFLAIYFGIIYYHLQLRQVSSAVESGVWNQKGVQIPAFLGPFFDNSILSVTWIWWFHHIQKIRYGLSTQKSISI